MRKTLISSALALASFASMVPAAAADYYGHDPVYYDNQVRVYGYPAGHLYLRPSERFIYKQPFRTQTHALHPYYRRTYNTRRFPDHYRRITHPQHQLYLEELYLNSRLPLRPLTTTRRCDHETRYRSSQWSPRVYQTCN